MPSRHLLSPTECWSSCRRLSLRVQATIAVMLVIYSDVETMTCREAPFILATVRGWMHSIHQLDPLEQVVRARTLLGNAEGARPNPALRRHRVPLAPPQDRLADRTLYL